MKEIISALLIALVFVSCSSSSENTYVQSPKGYNGNGTYKIGAPYKVFGKMYYPEEDYSYKEKGIASWYGADFHEGTTANGEKYDMNAMTAAHKTLPLPSIVKVTNLRNNKTAILRVNDRGPFVDNRIIDVSKRAAEVLGFKNQGTTRVLVEIMPKESKALKASLIGYSTDDYTLEENSTDNAFVIKDDIVHEYNIIKLDNNDDVYETSLNDTQPTKVAKQFVQLGAFREYGNAYNLKQQVIDNVYPLLNEKNINIYPVESNGQTLYRLRVGPYNNSEATKIYNAIVSAGFNGAKIISDK